MVQKCHQEGLGEAESSSCYLFSTAIPTWAKPVLRSILFESQISMMPIAQIFCVCKADAHACAYTIRILRSEGLNLVTMHKACKIRRGTYTSTTMTQRRPYLGGCHITILSFRNVCSFPVKISYQSGRVHPGSIAPEPPRTA